MITRNIVALGNFIDGGALFTFDGQVEQNAQRVVGIASQMHDGSVSSAVLGPAGRDALQSGVTSGREYIKAATLQNNSAVVISTKPGAAPSHRISQLTTSRLTASCLARRGIARW